MSAKLNQLVAVSKTIFRGDAATATSLDLSIWHETAQSSFAAVVATLRALFFEMASRLVGHRFRRFSNWIWPA
jgi:hypothetical protein